MKYKNLLITLSILPFLSQAQLPNQSRVYMKVMPDGTYKAIRYDASAKGLTVADRKKKIITYDDKGKVIATPKALGVTPEGFDVKCTVNGTPLITAVTAVPAVIAHGVIPAAPAIIAVPAIPATDPCAQVESVIPEGFGGLSFGSFGGGAEAKATLVRYNLFYSTFGSIPLYIMASTPVANDDSSIDHLNASLLGTDSGLINIKIADDVYTFNGNGKANGNGLCDFTGATDNLQGGCYLNSQAGIKMIEFTDDKGKSKQLGSFYTSIQLSFDFPISEEDGLTRAGRLAGGVGLSGYYANTDDIQSLYPEFKDTATNTVDELDKWYASFDASLMFAIDKEFSITASVSVPLVNDDVFDTVAGVQFQWAPK
ncbi:MAG: hypothetical protein QNK36_19070 [Colwellia sp.]|nr:hypothetical protein [Colwellia sp.]